MKVFLTGAPGAGKTTVLLQFKEITTRKLVGVYTQEIRDKEGRQGFTAVDFRGSHRILAHKKMFSHSSCIVAGKYFVDVDAISSFINPTLQASSEMTDAILVIDEIGRMEVCDPAFLPLVDTLLWSEQDILATIVYDPESWAEKYKTHPDITLITVTPENRDSLPQLLKEMFESP